MNYQLQSKKKRELKALLTVIFSTNYFMASNKDSNIVIHYDSAILQYNDAN